MFSGTPLIDSPEEKGYVVELIENAAKRIGATDAVRAFFNNGFANFVFDKSGEGLEEVITRVFDPLIERMTFNKDADLATASDLIEEFTGGVALSLLLGIGEPVTNFQSRRNQTLASETAANVAQPSVEAAAANLAQPAGPLMQLAQEMADAEVGRTAEAEPARPALTGMAGAQHVVQVAQEALASGAMSTEGVRAMVEAYDGNGDAGDYIAGINAAYRAGVNGEDIKSVRNAGLTPQQARAAYDAGQAARTELAKRNEISYNEATPEEGANNGGTQVRNEIEERGNRLGAGEQTRSLLERAEERRAAAVARRTAAQDLRNQIAASEESREVSAQSLGIPGAKADTMLRTVPESVKTEGMRSAETDAKEHGYTVHWFSGDNVTSSGIERAAIDPNTKQMWICVDDSANSAEQLYQHEKYHSLPENVKAQTAARLRTDRGAELDDLIGAYVDAYDGWDGKDNEFVTEEILADAYAGIDVYAGISDYYEGATRFSDDVRGAVAQNAAETEQTRGPPAGEVKNSSKKSDRPDRRRALNPGEMVNEYRDKINWPAYYQRITDAKYNPVLL